MNFNLPTGVARYKPACQPSSTRKQKQDMRLDVVVAFIQQSSLLQYCDFGTEGFKKYCLTKLHEINILK